MYCIFLANFLKLNMASQLIRLYLFLRKRHRCIFLVCLDINKRFSQRVCDPKTSQSSPFFKENYAINAMVNIWEYTYPQMAQNQHEISSGDVVEISDNTCDDLNFFHSTTTFQNLNYTCGSSLQCLRIVLESFLATTAIFQRKKFT